MTSDETTTELKMNPADLYREETFTDRRAGTIRRMTPVTADGSDDPARPVLYVGQAQILTPMGAMPIAFEIEAQTLGEAAEKFSAAANVAVERTAREIEELRREAASQIVIPKPGQGGMGGPGGMGGGGRIQMP